MGIIYCNDRFVPEHKATIPFSDRAFSWGLGLFESMRAYNWLPFRLRDHVARLRASAKHFKIRARFPDFSRVIPSVLRRNKLRNAYVRITLTDGGTLTVVARRWKFPPGSLYERGAKLLTVPWRRDPAGPLYGHKTLNYWENMLARWDAEKRGAIDALFLGTKDEVLEGSGTNIFFVKRGKVITPSLASHVLPGITRKVVIEAARLIGIRIQERRVTLAELLRADEVFVTNSLIEVMPVSKIDRKRIGMPGSITKDLMHAYTVTVARES